ncbi:MAG: hypothetical protein GX434_18795 [Peptococcaceae bacterium]|nr:hypothetical protein [Peptococcaceae bacterium]
MLENLARELIGLYREDLADYGELLDKMWEYELFLEGKTDSPKGERDESPSLQLLSRMDENFEKELFSFSTCREEIFTRLRDRKAETDKIENLISQETGIPFETSRLKPVLNQSLYEELQLLVGELKQRMGAVLQKDEVIIPRLRMELEAVKLELHRFQGAKRTKNAYEKTVQREARFIDKTK